MPYLVVIASSKKVISGLSSFGVDGLNCVQFIL